MDMHLHNLGALASSVPNPPFTYAASSVGGDDIEVDVEDDLDDNVSVIESIAGNGGKKSKKVGKDGKPTKGKKRGTIFKCESCSKVRTLNAHHLFHLHPLQWREIIRIVLSSSCLPFQTPHRPWLTWNCAFIPNIYAYVIIGVSPPLLSR